MTTTVLREKLRPPDLTARVLRRPRLERRWREWRDRRLVQVTAGAGWGKTTLLAAGARRSRRPVAWYSLDETDTEPLVFLSHLLAAITGRAPARGVRDRWEAARRDGPEVLLQQGVADLVARLRRRPGLLLTLDDVQVLVGSPVLPLLSHLVRYLPDGVTLVLGGREPAGLPLARLRAAGAVTDLTGDDLRFTPEETAALLRRRLGSRPDPALVEQVVSATEGWAAGIEVLLQVAADVGLDAALERLHRLEGDWFVYFAEEVMAPLTPAVRRFLVESSVLPRLRPGLCDRVLGRRDSARVLARLAGRNLFTHRLPGEEAVYRYHSLFRTYLRDQLDEVPPRRRRLLLRRAATALAEAGDHAAALAALAEAGDHAALLETVRKRGEAILAAAGGEVLRRALATVPPAQLAGSVPALRLLGRVADLEGDWETAARRYQQALDAARSRRARAELLSLLARIELRRGELDAAATLAGTALELVPATDRTVRVRLLTVLGVAACERGCLDEATRRHDQARRLLGRGRDPAAAHPDLYLLPGNIHYRRGDLAAADAAVRRALLVFRRRDDRRRICHCLGVLAFLAAEACRTGEATDLARECRRLADRLGYALMTGYAELALGRCALLGGDLDAARRHAGRAARVGRTVGESGLATLPPLLLGEVALAGDRLDRARRRTGEALAAARRLGVPYQEAQALLLRGRAADRGGATARRDADWEAAERIVRDVGMRLDLHRLLLWRLAAAAIRSADTRTARVTRAERALLRELMTGTAEMGHDFLFTRWERAAAVRVLPLALAADLDAERAARLLEEIGEAAVPHLAPLLEGSARRTVVGLLARIGGKEADRLLAAAAAVAGEAAAPARRAVAELRRRPAVPLHIRALGPLVVTAGRRRLDRDAWRSRRALRLLQILLVHRFRWVPRDVLLEALWPECDPRRAGNNLRQSLHLLRRVLEPDRSGNDAVHVRYRQEACRLDPGEGYSYDVESFERAVDTAAAARRTGRDDEALARLEEAVALYTDDFLSDSPYEEFTVPERERLRERFHRALTSLLELQAARGAWADVVPAARRGLACDPFGEEYHYHLVHGLHRLGNRHEALAAYRSYETVMERELGLMPSRRLRELAERIAAGRGRG